MKLISIFLAMTIWMIPSCSEKQKQKTQGLTTNSAVITFVELGSDKCVPCKAMQPVIRSIKEKYGDQINIILYDVWKSDQKKYAQEYGIKLIPTQVFLDKNGNEIMRHEGFFPEKEIDAFLQKQGLTPGKQS